MAKAHEFEQKARAFAEALDQARAAFADLQSMSFEEIDDRDLEAFEAAMLRVLVARRVRDQVDQQTREPLRRIHQVLGRVLSRVRTAQNDVVRRDAPTGISGRTGVARAGAFVRSGSSRE